MKITRQVVVFDAPDLDAETRFWAALTGGTVHTDDNDPGWRSIVVDGAWTMAVQHAPDLQPPDWPNGAPQQIHVDIHVDDIKHAHDEAIALGARLLQAGDVDAGEGFQVYADPAGHPFCLCWG